jgi:hypothetical protein
MSGNGEVHLQRSGIGGIVVDLRFGRGAESSHLLERSTIGRLEKPLELELVFPKRGTVQLCLYIGPKGRVGHGTGHSAGETIHGFSFGCVVGESRGTGDRRCLMRSGRRGLACGDDDRGREHAEADSGRHGSSL